MISTLSRCPYRCAGFQKRGQAPSPFSWAWSPRFASLRGRKRAPMEGFLLGYGKGTLRSWSVFLVPGNNALLGLDGDYEARTSDSSLINGVFNICLFASFPRPRTTSTDPFPPCRLLFRPSRPALYPVRLFLHSSNVVIAQAFFSKHTHAALIIWSLEKEKTVLS